MKFVICLVLALMGVFIYQSGENKSANKLLHSGQKMAKAGSAMVDEAIDVTKNTGDALMIPEAQKKLKEYSKRKDTK